MPKIYRDKSTSSQYTKLDADKFRVIANFLDAKADGENSTDVDRGSILDGNKTEAKKVIQVNDAGPSCDSDMPADDGNEFNGATKADPQDNNDAYLDKDRESPAANIVIPPYNDDASPETNPAKTPSDGVYQEPPTRDETTPPNVDNRTTLDSKLQYQVKSDDMDVEANVYQDDEKEATEAGEIWLNVCAYISQHERDSLSDDVFCGPHRSFPLRGPQDLHKIASLLHHAQDPSGVKRKAINRAKKMGWTKSLPESWLKPDEKTSAYEQTLELFNKLSATEVKSLYSKLETHQV